MIDTKDSCGIDWVDPCTFDPVAERDGSLYNVRTGATVANIKAGIPRFVSDEDNYAESFGRQWKTWDSTQSDSRNLGHNLRSVILSRTHFDAYNLEGKTLLECGMGVGNDTEILLQFPLRQIHSFDMSSSVDRARKYLLDDRLIISQASIYNIPYPDEAFDIVYCHRVLQHTPDPIDALRAVCRKVKPGGLLFAHAYKRSKRYMQEWKYKYRWLTKRLPLKWNLWYVMRLGPFMHRIVNTLNKSKSGREIAYRIVPFYHLPYKNPVHCHLTPAQLLEISQLVTFDALTPWFDSPIASEEFISVIEHEGFRIEHLQDTYASPIYCTARKISSNK